MRIEKDLFSGNFEVYNDKNVVVFTSLFINDCFNYIDKMENKGTN